MAARCNVYIDFDNDGSFATAGDDVSAYWKRVNVTGGMRNENKRVADVGTCIITLNNTSKTFSPDNTVGTYYGKLIPGLPVKVEATEDGIGTAVIFRGYVTSWKAQSGDLGSRETLVTCEDPLARLRNADIAMPLQENTTMDVLLPKVLATALDGAIATNGLEIYDLPTDGDTVTVGGTTYTFKDSLTGASNEVLIQDTDPLFSWPALNLYKAINGSTGAGTFYGSGSERHPYVTADWSGRRAGYPSSVQDTDYDLARTGTGYTHLATRVIVDDCAAQVQLFPNLTPTETIALTWTASGVWLYLKKTGLPTGTLTVTVETHNNGPSGTAAHADATGTLAESSLTTSYAWYWVAFADTVTLNTTQRYWVVLTTDRGASGTDYISWGGDSDTAAYTTGSSGAKAGGVWTIVTNVGFVFSFPERLDLKTNCKGAWGNDLDLAVSNADSIEIDATDFSGAANATIGASYETGQQTMPLAADLWSKGRTNALTAIEQVIDSEAGYWWWDAQDETYYAKNRDYWALRQVAGDTLTIDSDPCEPLLDAGVDVGDIKNHVIVAYTPRDEGTAASVIAKSSSALEVEARSGVIRWNMEDGFSDARSTTVLSYVEDGSATIIGAKSVIAPVAGTDYNVYKNSDGTGPTYNQYINLSLAVTGGGVEVSVYNPWPVGGYILDLQVRGTPLLNYNARDIVCEDTTSIAAYGKQAESVKVPFASTFRFAESLGNWTLARYKDAKTRIKALSLSNISSIDGTSVFGVQIGDMLTISEAQTCISEQRAMVLGYRYQINVNKTSTVQWFVMHKTENDYLILDHADYGLPDGTNIPSV